MSDRVTCPVCGNKEVPVDSEGMMGQHYLDGVFRHGMKLCAGSEVHPLAAACWLGEILDDTHLEPDP